MKRIVSLVLIMISLFLNGCGIKVNENLNETVSPKNNSLEIEGEWQINDYIILDKYVSQSEIPSSYIGQKVKIDNDIIEISDKQYVGVKFKVKVVREDYVISYESDYRVKNLNFKENDIRVYVANYKQSNLFEFFYGGENRSYMYYSGILFGLGKVGEIKQGIQLNLSEELININEEKRLEEGVYLGLKTPAKYDSSGELIQESYRTIWIKTENDELGPIYERKDIIFPRINGIWKLEKKEINNDGIHYEYFSATSLEGKNEELKDVNFQPKSDVYRTLNFVGNDYISTQLYEGNNFENIYLRNQILPVDNLNIDRGIVVQDIFTKDANEIFKKDYEEKMKEIPENDKIKLSKYINYSNFSMERINGKWNIVGRISPIENDTVFYDFPVNLKPNKRLINYDTLTIPWKVLKGMFPHIKDAYTSPEGNIAIIVMESKIQIHRIVDSNLQLEPLETIQLNNSETVIMAEWCAGEYVDKWYNVFKEDAVMIK